MYGNDEKNRFWAATKNPGGINTSDDPMKRYVRLAHLNPIFLKQCSGKNAAPCSVLISRCTDGGMNTTRRYFRIVSGT
jgi:hypothetical protein